MTPDDAWFHVVDALPGPLTDKVREAVRVLAVFIKTVREEATMMAWPGQMCDWTLCCESGAAIVRMGRAVICLCSEHLDLLVSTVETPGIIGVVPKKLVSSRWQGRGNDDD